MFFQLVCLVPIGLTHNSIFSSFLGCPVVRPCFHMGIAYVFSKCLFGPYRLCLYFTFLSFLYISRPGKGFYFSCFFFWAIASPYAFERISFFSKPFPGDLLSCVFIREQNRHGQMFISHQKTLNQKTLNVKP